VVDGETGLLVPVELRADDPMSPVDPDAFERDLASAVNRLMADPDLRVRMGAAGRRRAVERFSWESIADQTVDLYRSLIE
jgi:starch synthase